MGSKCQIKFFMLHRVIRRVYFKFLQSRIKTFDQFTSIASSGPLDFATINKNKDFLRPYYEKYIHDVSRPDMASSLELAAFMLTFCQANKCTKLLDMGSGLSSFVFRLYASDSPGVIVYSVDDDERWLEKTRLFLRQHNLSEKNTFTVDHFVTLNECDFDCILHDLNFVDVRINYTELILKMTKKGGAIIFDDVHKPDYLFSLLSRVRNINAEIFDLKPATLDTFGRFSLAVMKT